MMAGLADTQQKRLPTYEEAKSITDKANYVTLPEPEGPTLAQAGRNISALGKSEEPAVLREAKQMYPFIVQHNPQVKVSAGKQPGYAETFPAGEEGTTDWPRPAEFPIHVTGIEIYKPDKFSAHDLAGEFLHVDPMAHKTRAALMETLVPRQLQILKSQPDYENVGGELSDQRRLENVTDGLMRGYTVGQWPKEAIEDMGLLPRQRELLDNLKTYMTRPLGSRKGQ